MFSKKINLDDLTPTMRKAYDKENSLRKKALLISSIAGLVWGIVMMIAIPNTMNFFERIMVALAFWYSAGSIVMGIVHKRRWFININYIIPIIPFGWIVMYFTLIPVIFIGFVILPLDVILFFMKKPLVRNSEIMKICNTDEVAAEALGHAAAEAYLDSVNNNKTSTDKLNELKQMLDNGLITEEEFNKKKSELLDRI